MGIGDSGMLAVGTRVPDTVMDSLEKIVKEDSELISVYYGEDVKEEEAEELAGKIRSTFDGCEVELNCGGQPIYYYLISVE